MDKQIIKWLTDYINNTSSQGFVVGISGGIDSALTSTLCAQTGISTYVVSLPLRQKQDQLQRATDHIDWLCNTYKNVTAIEIDLTGIFDKFESTFIPYNSELAFANSRSRLRMAALYQIATYYNCLVVGTGNKVEDFGVGFFTKYGDGGVDISPIADLNKTQVRELAKRLGILSEIVLAKPTDGLWEDDRSDEEQIGATYEELEWAMEFTGDLSQLTGRQLEVIKIFNILNKKAQHKLKPIPVCQLNQTKK